MTLHQDFGARAEVNKPEDNRASGFYVLYGKRLFDVMLAIILLPFLVVLYAIVFICYLKAGNVIFAQDRVGKSGKIFRCYKFRSMHLDAEELLNKLIESDEQIALEWNTFQKLKGDPRITSIGNLLRKSRLDEFPQLINVLKGDMSFVGPRPFVAEQTKFYNSEAISFYFALRPGVTGHWQLNQPNSSPFSDRPIFDTQYFHKVSFQTDITLLLRTALLPFKFNGK